MGSWRNRPRRRFYRREKSYEYVSPPRYDEPETEASLSEFCDDGVPLWEKKYCTLIARLPWRKIVNSQKFMSCYSGNVLSWDDSAGEEAFHNAKKRYWSEINGLPCDIPLPNSDIYIDEIDWNTVIHPELIKDLEQDYFAPDDEKCDRKIGFKSRNCRNLSSIPSDGCNIISCKVDNPWECNNRLQSSDTLKETECWGQWASRSNDPGNITSDNNPWEGTSTQKKQTGKRSGWESCGDELLGFSQWGNQAHWSRDYDTNDNPWGRSCLVNGSVRDKECGGLKDHSWGWNQQGSKRLHNGGPWKQHNHVLDIRASNNGGCGDYQRNAWASNQWENNNDNNGEREDLRKTSGRWEAWNRGCRKREGSNQYINGYGSSRFQRYDNPTGVSWRSGKANKRVSFDLK